MSTTDEPIYAKKVFFCNMAKHLKAKQATICERADGVLEIETMKVLEALQKILSHLKIKERVTDLHSLKKLIEQYPTAPATHLLDLYNSVVDEINDRQRKILNPNDYDELKNYCNKTKEQLACRKDESNKKDENENEQKKKARDKSGRDTSSNTSGLSSSTVSTLYNLHIKQKDNKDHKNMVIILCYFSDEDLRDGALEWLSKKENFEKMTSYTGKYDRYFLSSDDIDYIFNYMNKKIKEGKSLKSVLQELFEKLDEVTMLSEIITPYKPNEEVLFHDEAMKYICKKLDIINDIVLKFKICDALVDAIQNAEDQCRDIYKNNIFDEEVSKIILRCLHSSKQLHNHFHEYIGG